MYQKGDLKEKKRFRWTQLIVGAVGFATLCTVACHTKLTLRFYTLETPKLHSPLRIAVVTDLHSCVYGIDQKELLAPLHQQAPDAVMLCGDIIDDHLPTEPAFTFLAEIGKRYPCFYVSGNHEQWSGESDALKAHIQALGIRVLEGQCVPVTLAGSEIQICGLDDPSVGYRDFISQLDRCTAQLEPSLYSLLLSHRPEEIRRYLASPFDLILAGHTHGGQWRIPGVMNGLIAPNQGLFPKFAGGLYAFERSGDAGTDLHNAEHYKDKAQAFQSATTTALVVSRGLARESTRIPRVFNPPELVFVDLIPAHPGKK